MTSLPFAPPTGYQEPLPNNSPAFKQFGRLLDALLILDAEGACSIGYLARRVGLQPERLRRLLSVFMTAGADALEGSAPLTISFGTQDGPLTGDEEHDDAQATADVVWLESRERSSRWLVADLGRRPVLVKDVAKALLAASLMVSDEDQPMERRAGIAALAQRLSSAMGATIDAPAGGVVHDLQDAIGARRAVRFRYQHPWTGESAEVSAEPYDVRRQRDRLVLDAGVDGALVSFDVSGISDLAESDATFTPPVLPPRDARTPKIPVVLRVPADGGEEARIESGWGGVLLSSRQDGYVQMRIDLDGDPSDPGVGERLGVLLVQLGPRVTVVSPPELVAAAGPVARRLLAKHSSGAATG